jgi:putative ABC transport system ATP-binding protein
VDTKLTQPNSSLITLQNLCKEFQEGTSNRTVIYDVNISFNEGEFIALLGHSGSGKSTLLNLIAGIEKPTKGTVLIKNTAITELSERACTLFRRDNIGFIFQFFNLIPTLTVLENVTLPQELSGKKGKQLEESAIKLLGKVGLGDRCNAFPDKLSGGQQQRVAIARALLHQPMLLLADEPTGNLDEETGEKVLKLLLELTRDANKTLIMATHNPEIAKLANRVLRMNDGHLQEVTPEKNPEKTPEATIESSIQGVAA